MSFAAESTEGQPEKRKRSRERGPARYGFWTDSKVAEAIGRSRETVQVLRRAGAFDKDDGMAIAEFVRKFKRQAKKEQRP